MVPAEPSPRKKKKNNKEGQTSARASEDELMEEMDELADFLMNDW